MKKFKHKDVALALSAASLGIGATNLGVNLKRKSSDRKYQERQLEAMERLTNSLNKVDKHLDTRLSEKPSGKKGIFGLFQKNNSNTSDYAIKGAALGGVLAGGALPFLPDKVGATPKKIFGKDKNGKDISWYDWIDNPNYKHPKFKQKYNNLESTTRQILLEIGGIAVGATLGALAGAIVDFSNYVSGKKTLNNRLMKDVLVNLKKMGFQEGRDYTRDPKVSSLLKTKVCLVISKSADEMRLLINTVQDNKLKNITRDITKNLPTMSTVTEKVSDRFNELNITTMTSNNGDALWIASLTEKFIKAGYPVYLVEVG